MVGDLVPALRCGAQRLGIELADAARREDGRLDLVAVEQLDQPPDADPAAELALGELLRRLVEQTAQQHGVEVGGEVDGEAHAVGPRHPIDDAVLRAVVGGACLQGGDVAVESVDDCGVHRAVSCDAELWVR